MVRLYESRSYRVRLRIAAIAFVGFVLLGGWYITFQAIAAPPGADSLGPWALSIVFLLAGCLGLYRLTRDSRDRVIALHADAASGRAVLRLWSPFGGRRVRTSLDRLHNWRPAPPSRYARYPGVLADLDGRAEPLVFLLRRGAEVPEALRRLLPEAAAAFDRALGNQHITTMVNGNS